VDVEPQIPLSVDLFLENLAFVVSNDVLLKVNKQE
jgi:hypothetical protein